MSARAESQKTSKCQISSDAASKLFVPKYFRFFESHGVSAHISFRGRHL